MWKYVIKRIILALFTVVIILSITFILMKLLPFQIPPNGKEMYLERQVNLGYMFSSTNGHLGKVEAVVTAQGKKPVYYYQTPILQQLFSWFANIFTKGQWGTCTAAPYENMDAIHVIITRLPNSMEINIWSVIFSVPLGILLGIIAALKKNKFTDNLISVLVMVFISIPGFVLIILAQKYLGYQWNIFPPTFKDDPNFWIRARSLVLPIILLSLGSICSYCRFTRAELCDVMESEYLLLARTKGLTKRQAIIRHALRNAMVPIVPSILAEFIGILGGSMILENIFEIQGIGGIFIHAIEAKDYNLLMVDMAFFTTISLLAGVILDISYGFIDPRIRMGER